MTNKKTDLYGNLPNALSYPLISAIQSNAVNNAVIKHLDPTVIDIAVLQTKFIEALKQSVGCSLTLSSPEESIVKLVANVLLQPECRLYRLTLTDVDEKGFLRLLSAIQSKQCALAELVINRHSRKMLLEAAKKLNNNESLKKIELSSYTSDEVYQGFLSSLTNEFKKRCGIKKRGSDMNVFHSLASGDVNQYAGSTNAMSSLPLSQSLYQHSADANIMTSMNTPINAHGVISHGSFLSANYYPTDSDASHRNDRGSWVSPAANLESLSQQKSHYKRLFVAAEDSNKRLKTENHDLQMRCNAIKQLYDNSMQQVQLYQKMVGLLQNQIAELQKAQTEQPVTATLLSPASVDHAPPLQALSHLLPAFSASPITPIRVKREPMAPDASGATFNPGYCHNRILPVG